MPGGVRLQAAAVRDSARVRRIRRSVVSTSRAEGEGLLRPRVKCVEERDEARDLGEALVRGFSSTPDNSRPMPSKYRPSASRRSAVVHGAKARRRDVVQLEAAAPASVQAAARDHYPSAVPFRQRFKTPERASDEDGAGVVSGRKRRRGARACPPSSSRSSRVASCLTTRIRRCVAVHDPPAPNSRSPPSLAAHLTQPRERAVGATSALPAMNPENQIPTLLWTRQGRRAAPRTR
jgi:hypothetical protein